MKELWNIYNAQKQGTGRVAERRTYLRDDEYHIVVNVWLKNAAGEYLISQRSPVKSDPLKWEPTGGSVQAGESSLQGAIREVQEELGITLNPEDGKLICSGLRHYEGCPDILDVWSFPCDAAIESIVLQEGETCAAQWASPEKIRAMLEDGSFIQNQFDYLANLGI